MRTNRNVCYRSTQAKPAQEKPYFWKRLTFISDLLGGEIFASSILTSPGGILFKHWSGIKRGSESSNISTNQKQDSNQHRLHARLFPRLTLTTHTTYFLPTLIGSFESLNLLRLAYLKTELSSDKIISLLRDTAVCVKSS